MISIDRLVFNQMPEVPGVIRTLLVVAHSRGYLLYFGSNIGQQLVAFLGVLVFAKLLPPEEFGLVRIAMAYVAVATIIAAGGLTAPVLRYCADPCFNSDERRRILGTALRRLVLVAVTSTVGALALIFLSGREGKDAMVLAAYALQIPALAAGSLLLVYLQAVQRFRYLAYSQVCIRLLSFVLTASATWLYGLNGLLVSAVVAAIAGALPLFMVARPLFHETALPKDFGILAKYSVVGMMISAVGQYADILILDWVGADRKLVAIYSLATIFFFALSAMAGAVQSVATPMFTNLMSDPTVFRSRLRRWTIGLSAAALPSAACVIALAWGLEKWFLSSSYAGLSHMVAILMLRFLLWCTYAVGGAALVGIGAIKQGTWIAALTTCLALVLGYPLCLAWNVWGAAWTQAVVALASALLVRLIIRRELALLAERHAAVRAI